VKDDEKEIWKPETKGMQIERKRGMKMKKKEDDYQDQNIKDEVKEGEEEKMKRYSGSSQCRLDSPSADSSRAS